MNEIKIEKRGVTFVATLPSGITYISSNGTKWFGIGGCLAPCLNDLRAAYFNYLIGESSPQPSLQLHTGDPEHWDEGIYRGTGGEEDVIIIVGFDKEWAALDIKTGCPLVIIPDESNEQNNYFENPFIKIANNGNNLIQDWVWTAKSFEETNQ